MLVNDGSFLFVLLQSLSSNRYLKQDYFLDTWKKNQRKVRGLLGGFAFFFRRIFMITADSLMMMGLAKWKLLWNFEYVFISENSIWLSPTFEIFLVLSAHLSLYSLVSKFYGSSRIIFFHLLWKSKLCLWNFPKMYSWSLFYFSTLCV